ncbi:MAG TPA: hypothetical protein PKV33_08045 [Methanothrix sp.]|nr:hypothetical protein [Methanothrix sp.]
MNHRPVTVICIVLAFSIIVMAGAANYMYEKASVQGTGYKNLERIVSTQHGFNGSKLVEKQSGSGNIIADKTELEAERQIGSRCGGAYAAVVSIWKDSDEPDWPKEIGDDYGDFGPWGPPIYWDDFLPYHIKFKYRKWPTGFGPTDYINYTAEQEQEYMPVSYQTGTYDQKWTDKLCVQNYRIGAAMTEMYTHAEHLQRSSEIKTRGYSDNNTSIYFKATSANAMRYWAVRYPPVPCCTGVLEANLNSNVIGVAHIGWISRDPNADDKLRGRHAEYGRSVEDLTGVFSIEKFIQLWGNSTCGAISVNWLPCT